MLYVGIDLHLKQLAVCVRSLTMSHDFSYALCERIHGLLRAAR